jgi:photosystem II stability/assembly factor-like uncharacterized protein
MSLRLSDYYPLGSPNIVYTVGDQIISGVKNFYDRPRYLNTGLLTFGDFTEIDFLLTGNVSGIFDSFVLSDNLFFVSQPSGQITGNNRTGYYDGGNFLGKTKLTQNNTKLINIGDNWISTETARLWTDVSMSSNGQYITAVIGNGRIYISNNYGETWGERQEIRDWKSVRISSDGKYQITSVENGNIYVSNDYGNTWISKGPSTSWNYVDISSNGQYQIAAGAGNGNFIYISSDYGNTWIQNTSSRNLNLSVQWVSAAISSDGRYITVAGGNGKIFISQDYGQTWSEKNITTTYLDLAMSSDGQFQTAGTFNGIYISSDYGNTWKLTSNRVINKIRMSSCGKYQIFISNNNNIHFSQNYGQTWVEKTPLSSIALIQWQGISISSDAKYIVACPFNNPIYLSKADEMIDGNIYAQNLVYNIGNQTISGIKNFNNRLTVNNSGILLSGEALTKDNFKINSGVFEQDYRFLQKITGDGEFANYNLSVFNDNGDILAFGGPSAGANNRGAILIYTENKNNGWEIKQKITGNFPDDNLGLRIGMNGDGSVIIGSTLNNNSFSRTGVVSIYTGNSNSKWELKDSILNESLNNGITSIGISKDASVIGVSSSFDSLLPNPADGSIRLYTGNSINGWNFKQKLSVIGGDAYGSQTYLNYDGTICIITSRNDDDGGNNAGGAAVFTGNRINGWAFKEKILGIPSPVGSQFGSTVGPRFGSSLAASEDASIIALGGPSYNSPLVSSSDNSVSIWNLKQVITGFNSGQGFGSSLKMNSNGSILLIGAGSDDQLARNAGIAYAYTGNPTNGWNLSKTFLGDFDAAYKAASVAPLYGRFLNAAAINKSGNIFLLGSNFEVQSNGVGYGGGLIYTTDKSNFEIGHPQNLEFLSISGNVKIDGNLSLNKRPTVNGLGVLLQGEAAGASASIENIVYTTGNQTISGTKNFVSRPTVNGTGVLLQGEAAAGVVENVVYTTGDQTISGVKNFNQVIIAPEIRGSGDDGANRKIDLNLGQLYWTTTLISLDYRNRILSGTWITNERLLVNNTGVLLSGEAIRSNNTITTMIKLTQAEYNALSPKDSATFYVIVG